MNGIVTLRNFRCFDWHNPGTLELSEGFTAYIGPNNSGKSAILKSVYELRTAWGYIADLLSDSQNTKSLDVLGVSDLAELANDYDPSGFEIEIEIYPCLELMDGTNYVKYLKVYCDVSMRRLFISQMIATNDSDFLRHSLDLDNVSKKVIEGNRIQFRDISASTIFISDFLRDLQNSKYFPAFRNAINEGAGNYYDLPVGTALVQQWNGWKAGHSRAQKNAISSVEKQIAELLDFETLQINADLNQKSLDVIINDRPQKLYEVGAGVAQLIIVLAAALISKAPFILIDEPELNLHPALQLKFLIALGRFASIGLIYSTHSLGLARSSAQNIYSVSKESAISSKVQIFGDQSPNYCEWLGELSYSGRLDLGCDQILLLEGPTEILCFQQLLRKVGKDQNYLLMSLGGSSLINGNVGNYLSELTRLVSVEKIHIFIDSERKSAEAELIEERRAFKAVCESMKIHVALTERRATENYFTQEALDRALGKGYQVLQPYQKLKESHKPWHKSLNWKIIAEMNISDIRETDLGRYIESL